MRFAIVACTIFLVTLSIGAAEDQPRLLDLAHRADAIIYVRVTFENDTLTNQKVVKTVQVIDTLKKANNFSGEASFRIASSEFAPNKRFTLGSRLVRDFIVFSGLSIGEHQIVPSDWTQYLSVDDDKVWTFDHYIPKDLATSFIKNNAG